MRIAWNLTYFGNIIFGTFLNKFFQKYWRSGHFSLCGKIKYALKLLFIMILALIILLILSSVAIYFVFGMTGLHGAKAALLVMSNVFGVVIMVILLSYGLFALPVVIFRYYDHHY